MSSDESDEDEAEAIFAQRAARRRAREVEVRYLLFMKTRRNTDDAFIG